MVRNLNYFILGGCLTLAACKTSHQTSEAFNAPSQGDNGETLRSYDMGQAEPMPSYAKGFLDLTNNFRMWASCDRKSYVIGLSQGRRIFCVQDKSTVSVAAEPVAYVRNVVSTQSPRFASGYDWAHQRYKIECARGFYVTGIIADADRRIPDAGHLGIICTQDSLNRIEKGDEKCSTVWFDRDRDTRPEWESPKRSVDWHPNHVKGQCSKGNYIAGIAYFDEWVINHENPNAILCCEWKK